MNLLLRSLLGAVLLSSTAAAQLAQSPGYRLDDFALAGGGGGASSLGFAAFVALPAISGGEVTSTGFRAQIGFLAGWNPEPTNAPVIFGVTPDTGPLLGGTPLTIAGMNFDKFGAAPSVTVSIGGNAAGAVSVQSDTQLTCASPIGTAGAKNVVVGGSFGSDTLTGGFRYTAGLLTYGTGTPGCTGSELLYALDAPSVGNAQFGFACTNAPPSSTGLLLVANAQDLAGSDPFAIGVLLHVNLLTATLVLNFNMPSNAAGVGMATTPIPNNPALIGTVYYAQSLWSWTTCVPSVYGLSSSRGLAVTIEP